MLVIEMVGSLNGFEQGLYVLAHFTIAIYGPPNMVNGSVYDYGECSLQLHEFEKVFFLHHPLNKSRNSCTRIDGIIELKKGQHVPR